MAVVVVAWGGRADRGGAWDVVITRGCGGTCRGFQGKAYEDWQFEDPTGQPVPVVRAIVADVEARVLDLLARIAP